MANLKTLRLGRLRRGLSAALVMISLVSCGRTEAPPPTPTPESASLKRVRQLFARVPQTLARNHKSFQVPDGAVSGFGAGDAYPQIWLRDSAWIVPAAAAYHEADSLTSWLDLHLAAAGKNGRLRDWVAAAPPETFREWAPRVAAFGPLAVDTNSNESDQEPSAALAYCRIREALDPVDSPDNSERAGRRALVLRSMEALLRDRTDRKSGLVWSGLTADWGDVSPLYPDQRAIYLDAGTPRTLSLYSNVMAYGALRCLAHFEPSGAARTRAEDRASKLGQRIREAFWMKERGYFRVRRSLDAVPPPFDAEEDGRFALGGNALAALFGVADDAQADSIFAAADRLRVAKSFTTISTTLIPPYAAGVFLHPAMREPFQYQNGGQWDWFGALLIQAEFERGHSARARLHLDQVAARTLRAGPGLHEWYAQDGSPKGSGAYAATAAALHTAIVRGLLGVSRSGSGYRVVVRTGETLRPFEIPHRAASERLVVSQTVGASSIEVKVAGEGRLLEICSVLPPNTQPGVANATDRSAQGEVRRIGSDILMCADVAGASLPVEVRFALRPSG